MRVILLTDIKGTGKKGDIVDVSAGFAQNFLLKNKKAIIADNTAVNENKMEKEANDFHYQQELKSAKELAEKLNTVTALVKIKGGENGKVFGSVTSTEIANCLNNQGYTVNKKQINLKEPIKYAGNYTVEVKLFIGVVAKVAVRVELI